MGFAYLSSQKDLDLMHKLANMIKYESTRGVSKIIMGFTQEWLQAPKFEATMGGIMVTIIRKRSLNQTIL